VRNFFLVRITIRRMMHPMTKANPVNRRVKPTNITLDPEIRQAARMLCFRRGVSFSGWVNKLIERELNRSKAK
jgi:hypothetical protein